MSFGKPKNPLLELVNPVHTDYHIEKLEAQMVAPGALPIKCGCVVLRTLRGRVMQRCALHEKNNDPAPDDET
jgi:hypothetical protein